MTTMGCWNNLEPGCVFVRPDLKFWAKSKTRQAGPGDASEPILKNTLFEFVKPKGINDPNEENTILN